MLKKIKILHITNEAHPNIVNELDMSLPFLWRKRESLNKNHLSLVCIVLNSCKMKHAYIIGFISLIHNDFAK